MKKRVRLDITPRLLGLQELTAYLSLGETVADRLATEAGAKRKYGKRVLYDRKLIDKYLDNQGENNG